MDRRNLQLGVGALDLTDLEKGAIIDVINSGRLSYGPVTRKFENDFAQMHDSKYSVFVNSGTSALCIAIACLREVGEWEDGDEIIIPALTFVATANVIIQQNLTPVFVDCDSRTYNIDPSKIEEKITPRTKAIMAVHLFGQTADMDPIMDIAKKHNLRVIEDSCETMGVTYKGRKTGSFGDISCFSTYIAHLVVTGVGGLVVTSDKKYAEIIRSLANHGRDNIYMSIDDDKGIDDAKFQEVIKRRFRFVRSGYSFRATEMEAALGGAQLQRLPEILSKRKHNEQWLTDHLRKYEQWLQLPYFDSSVQEHAFMMYPIVIRKESSFTKEHMVEFLEKWNVETRDMLPLINQPVYSSLHITQSDYPVADWVNTHGFYIGCHQALSGGDLQYIVDVIDQYISSI